MTHHIDMAAIERLIPPLAPTALVHRRRGNRASRADVSARTDSDTSAPVPNWPYGREVIMGTQEYADVIAWFLRRGPLLKQADLAEFHSLLIDGFPGRLITAEISPDCETGTPTLRFAVYGFGEHDWLRSTEEKTFFDKLPTHLHDLLLDVIVAPIAGMFSQHPR